jgi:hypothetical protein
VRFCGGNTVRDGGFDIRAGRNYCPRRKGEKPMNKFTATRIAAIAVMILAAAFGGCGKKGIDTSKLERSFQASEPTAKQNVQSVVQAVEKQDYAAATASLQKLATQAKLTPDQQEAIKEVLEQVKAKLTETLNKTAGDAQKMMTDLQKSIKR